MQITKALHFIISLRFIGHLASLPAVNQALTPYHFIKSYCSLKSSHLTEGCSLDLTADIKPAQSWSSGLISVNIKKNTVFAPLFLPASISLKPSLRTNHYLWFERCFYCEVTREIKLIQSGLPIIFNKDRLKRLLIPKHCSDFDRTKH